MSEATHKHKMKDVASYKVRLYSGDGTATPLYDEFSFKQCDCGFKEPTKVERKSGKTTPSAPTVEE